MYSFDELKNRFDLYSEEQKIYRDPQGLYDPINYIMDLGGKKIRPVSTLIACNIFNDDIEGAFPLAYALEIFHNFTLAHDDLMDDANIRRGRDTMHVRFSNNHAILSGDAMLIIAYQYIFNSTSDPALRDKINRIFSKTAIEICEGQQMDMDFESQQVVELSEYLLMIKLKTAVLLATCLQCGALIGGADDSDAKELYFYGLNIGLAFQVMDDLLDLYGDSEGFGKKTGGDIIQKKKTFLYLKALELANEGQRKKLINIYNQTFQSEDDKIEQVREIFDSLKVKQHALNLMAELTQNADDHLSTLSVANQRSEILSQLGKKLLARNK